MKRNRPQTLLFLILAALLTFLSLTEASVTRTQPKKVLPLWSRRMPGAISSLSLSQNGQVILVATAPDPDIGGGSHHHLLSRYNAKGRLIWQQRVKFPIRDQTISTDGSLIVTSNYEGKLIAMDGHGKTVWEGDGMCRLKFLSNPQLILCYHDDDADPRFAFDLWDLKGKKVSSYPIEKDILALKIAPDQKGIVLGLVDGQIHFLGPFSVGIKSDPNLSKTFSEEPYSLQWKQKVPGEVVDIAVSAAENLTVAVLFRGPIKKQENPNSSSSNLQQLQIALFDRLGKLQKTLIPAGVATQIEMSSSGDQVFYYGDSKEGQWVGSFSITRDSQNNSWRQGENVPLEYSSFITPFNQFIAGGFAIYTPKTRENHLYFFDRKGNKALDLLLKSEEGAYLYDYHITTQDRIPFVAVGMDDGHLNGFLLKNVP